MTMTVVGSALEVIRYLDVYPRPSPLVPVKMVAESARFYKVIRNGHGNRTLWMDADWDNWAGVLCGSVPLPLASIRPGLSPTLK